MNKDLYFSTIGGSNVADINSNMSAALRRSDLLDDASLSRAERAAARTEKRLDHTLSELGMIEEDRLAQFVADWAGLPCVSEGDFHTIPSTGVAWDREYLRRARIAPVSLENGRLILAMSDPLDLQLADTIAFHHNVLVERAVASARTIDNAISQLFGAPDSAAEIDSTDVAASDLERLQSLANEGPVVRLVNDIIAKAVDDGVSDIHFESQETDLWVRFRVDGVLRSHTTVSDARKNAVVSRLKVLANLNISERRLPQDGRVRMPIRGRDIDFRVSSMPTQHGESVVLRVLDRSRLALDWNALGFDADLVASIEFLTSRPNGIFLVTGPTGSGKTTTLYTALSKLDASARKIVTIEDPIEFALPGVNQVQVEPEIGYTFAIALRATLRQDPNVVMVGEIRYLETAENAIRAALMGRMVLSTVHTNSALGAIDRLIDLGVPPYLLGSTLRGVLSQRLVRRLCWACAKPDDDRASTAMLARILNENGPEAIRPMHPVGCDACGGSGFSGRMVIAELLTFDAWLQDVVSNWDGSVELKEKIAAERMTPLKEHGARAAARGKITISELFQTIDLS